MSKTSSFPCGCTRRESMLTLGAGFGSLAFLDLLSREGRASDTPPNALSRAKHVIYLFLYGGPPQMDTFDYKPELQKRDGEEIEIEIRRHIFKKQKLLGSPRKFAQYGEAGLWISDVFPNLSKHADKLCVVKSLFADTFAHGSAMIQLNSGRILQGYPSMGSWLSYGLGSLNENLPSFVVMVDPRGGPISGAANWSSGFMPARFQGTPLRPQGEPILDLADKSGSSLELQRLQTDTLARINAEHAKARPGYSELRARMASYELAFQLQSTAPEALDLSRESAATLDLYGINAPRPTEPKESLGPATVGRQLLIARRLVERGARFVQVYSGGGHTDETWDAHGKQNLNLRIHCPEIDQPLAALITDLSQRGLLDETLILVGGEFGRQPVAQAGDGRDHNPKGFTYLLVGGGVKGGFSYGETDDFGHEAVIHRRHVRDLHATVLNLMGIDHKQLTYLYGGLEQKLTGVQEAHVIEDILA